jgi:transposase-like protein
MPKVAKKKSRRSWTATEKARLLKMAARVRKGKLSVKDVCKTLGRSEGAVRQMAWALVHREGQDCGFRKAA